MVILKAGKYAGKKAVVLRVFDEGTQARQFPHCLVVGLRKEPGKVIFPKLQHDSCRGDFD